MAKLQDDSQPRVDISLPNVISPKPGGIYDSPVPFELHPGSGGHYPAKAFICHIYYKGPEFENLLVADSRFAQPLEPGPHEVHACAKWWEGSNNETSDWVFIKDFYVRTPPEN